MSRHFIVIFLLILWGFMGCRVMHAGADEIKKPLKILIFSGANNHDWKSTTPALKKIYEQSGHFIVDVTNDPGSYTADKLAPYDAIVSNWTNYPGKERVWGKDTEEAFLDFIENGKGFVLFHAASACFYDWPDYQRLIGATWGKGTGHGSYHKFDVTITDKKHPITEGMKDFVITDELWHRMKIQPVINVLCTAFSAKDKGGTGKQEPVALWTQFGRGRCFYNVLGHDARSMQNENWKLLMLRGTQWAATGKATIVPVEKPSYQWQQDETSLALFNRGKVVWKLTHNKKEGKPYFHPLALTDGSVLTWLRPGDHKWHRALWFSWKKINQINYWEENKQGISQGTSELVDVKVKPQKDFSARIEITMSYHPPGKEEILAEKRFIKVTAPDKKGIYKIDWLSVFTAGKEKVVLDRTPIQGEPSGSKWGGYAGLSLRLAQSMRQSQQVLNSNGLTNAQTHGQKAHWLDMTGKSESGRIGGITVIDHTQNLRHPSPWYVAQGMPYFGAALLFDKPLILPAGDSLCLRYRIIVHPGPPDKCLIEKERKGFNKMNN